MDINVTLVVALSAWVAGLLLSVCIEALMTPRPSQHRPWGAWALHVALWTLTFDAFLLVLGRPWFSMAIVSAVMLTAVLGRAINKAFRF